MSVKHIYQKASVKLLDMQIAGPRQLSQSGRVNQLKCIRYPHNSYHCSNLELQYSAFN